MRSGKTIRILSGIEYNRVKIEIARIGHDHQHIQ